MSQVKQSKIPYRAPTLTAHGTIRNMTNADPGGPGGPDGAPNSYTS